MRQGLLFLLLVSFFSLSAQDSTRYIRYGLVPFQFLCRSAGAYIEVNLPDSNIQFEYRPTYTFPTEDWNPFQNMLTQFVYLTYDKTYYQGINNNFLFRLNPDIKGRLLLVNRIWWYGNKVLPLNNVNKGGYSLQKTAVISSTIYGLGFGWEFFKESEKRRKNFRYYLNLSYTYMIGKRHIINYDNKIKLAGYNQTYGVAQNLVNITFGLELGFKKELPKRAH